jgi:hypothetical protein
MTEKILIISGSGLLGNQLSKMAINENVFSTYKTNKRLRKSIPNH